MERHESGSPGFAARLLIVVACVYGPFVVAPLMARALGFALPVDGWFGALPVLPGRFVATFCTDAVGAVWVSSIAMVSALVVAVWVLVAAWLARESRQPEIFSALVSVAFATVTVMAFVG